MIGFILFSLCVAIAVYLVIARKKDDPRLPPGPKGYPLFGNILDIDTEKMHLKLTQWAKEYGDIFSIKLFGTRAIVISSPELIREALITKPFNVIFSDRPPTFIGKYVFGSDIAFASYGQDWQARRKVVYRVLKLHGEGGTRIQEMVIRELRRAVEQIRQTKGEPFEPYDIVTDCLCDIINCSVSVTYF
jgi:cytochrome P450